MVSSDTHDNPCLGYHDTTHNLCALCKPGTARILTSYKDNGETKYATKCGAVRTPNRNSEGSYEYLDPRNVDNTEIHEQKYECVVSPYYETAEPTVYASMITQKYYPR